MPPRPTALITTYVRSANLPNTNSRVIESFYLLEMKRRRMPDLILKELLAIGVNISNEHINQ